MEHLLLEWLLAIATWEFYQILLKQQFVKRIGGPRNKLIRNKQLRLILWILKVVPRRKMGPPQLPSPNGSVSSEDISDQSYCH